MAYTVLGGSSVLPGGIPRNKWYNDVGALQGTMSRQATDALLAVILGQISKGGFGPVPTAPTPSNPGTFNFPPGSQSPGEAAQIRQLGGVPTQQGVLSRATQQPGTTGVTFTPPTRFGLQPDLARQLQQAQLKESTSKTSYYDTLSKMATPPTPATTPTGDPTGTPKPLRPPMPSLTSRVVSELWSQAEAGNSQSMDKIRLLALEFNDPEAIALLQWQGEL